MIPTTPAAIFTAGLVLGAAIGLLLVVFRSRRMRLLTALAFLGLAVIVAGVATSLSQDAGLPSWRLPAEPMDVEMVNDRVGYATLADGRIIRFTLPVEPSGTLDWDVVADGLAYPRGVAIAGSTLFVGEMGPLPCEPPYPYCFAPMLDVASDEAGEREIIEQSSGRLVRFRIDEDGSLTDKAIIIEGIPIVNSEHGVNDVEVGPDGAVYVAVGNVDFLGQSPDVYSHVEHENFDWLGTVLRVEDGTPQVFARGLRNVYGLSFGPDGSLFVVDNDGVTWSGWRDEELIAIEQGADYGFPDEGSFGPFTRRTGSAIAAIAAIGSAGIAWVGDDTIAVGSCGRLTFVRLSFGDGRWRWTTSPSDSDRLSLGTDNCVSAIARLSDGRLVLSTVGSNSLYMVTP